MSDFAEYLNQREFMERHKRLVQFVSKGVWLEKLEFYTLDFAEWTVPEFPRMRLKVEFALGEERDIFSLVNDPVMDSPKNKSYYLQKYWEGHKLLIGKMDNNIVFFLWAVTGKKDMMNKYLLLDKDEIAIERGYTRKEFRGHGLFNYGLLYLFPQVLKDGFKSCLTEIAPYNTPMVRTAIKTGFVRTDSYYYWFRQPFKQYVFPKGPIANRFVNK